MTSSFEPPLQLAGTPIVFIRSLDDATGFLREYVGRWPATRDLILRRLNAARILHRYCIIFDHGQIEEVRAFQNGSSRSENFTTVGPVFGRSLSRENHHVRIPRRRERRHGRAQERLHAGRPAAMGLYDPLRPVDDQERGSAQLHGQGPLWHLGGTGQERRSGLDARQAVLTRLGGRLPLRLTWRRRYSVRMSDNCEAAAEATARQ